jgi:putative endonuclease
VGFLFKNISKTLVYHEEFDTKSLAYKRELEVKKWKSRKRLEKMIEESNK